MTLDKEEYRVGPGDLAAVFPGGSHVLVSDSDHP